MNVNILDANLALDFMVKEFKLIDLVKQEENSSLMRVGSAKNLANLQSATQNNFNNSNGYKKTTTMVVKPQGLNSFMTPTKPSAVNENPAKLQNLLYNTTQ